MNFPNVFKRPLNLESLDSWCKILDDIAKVAILATPVVIYGTGSFSYKIANALFLSVSAYFCIFTADFIRKNKTTLNTTRN